MLDDDYPYLCVNCNKKYKRNDHLRRHFGAVHDQIKYTCTFCGTKMSRKDLLKRHIGNVHPSLSYSTNNNNNGSSSKSSAPHGQVPPSHGQTAQKVPKEKNYYCEYCSKAFYRKDHVTRHVRNVHHIGKPNTN